MTKIWGGKQRNLCYVPNSGRRLFSSPKHTNWVRGPPSLLSCYYTESCVPDLMQHARKPEHSPPFSTQITNKWSSTSDPHTTSRQNCVCPYAPHQEDVGVRNILAPLTDTRWTAEAVGTWWQREKLN